MGVCFGMCLCVCACVRACVRACVHVRVSGCLCVLGLQGPTLPWQGHPSKLIWGYPGVPSGTSWLPPNAYVSAPKVSRQGACTVTTDWATEGTTLAAPPFRILCPPNPPPPPAGSRELP